MPGTSPLPHLTPFVLSNKPKQQPVIGRESAVQLKKTPDGNIKIQQPWTEIRIRNKKKMLFDDALQHLNRLLKIPRSDVSVKTYWFPTPQSPSNPSYHTPIQKCILTKLYALEALEKLDPQANQKSREHLLSNFGWTDSTPDQQTKASKEDPLVQFNGILARHRVDIGINIDFKVQLAPLDDRAA